MTKDGVVSLTLAKQLPTSKNPSQTPRSGSTEDTLTKVLGMHDEWKGYRKKLVDSWRRDTKLYNNERVTQNRYMGVSDTFVPMAFSTVETMVAALATGDLSTTYLPQDIYKYLTDRLMPGYTGTMLDEQGMEVQETKEQYLVRAIQNAITGGPITDETLGVLNALFDYFWEAGDWDKELEYLIRSGLKIGSGAWWLTWKNNRPCLETVPFPDFIFDPKAKDDESAQYMGRRYLANLDDLKKEEIIDPVTGKAKKRYKDLSKVGKKPDSGYDDKSDRELKEEILNISTLSHDEKEDPKQVEVIEIFTNDRMYTVVNRRLLAEDAENPFKAQAAVMGIEYKGIIPGITWANYKDESLFTGKSEIATFWQEQERLNDVTNQKSDAVTRALLQQKRADPSLKSQKESFNVPGAVIWATSGQYDTVPQDQVPSIAFTEENSIKNNIREVTATDQIVKGVGSTADVTATEAKLQVAQSGQRIELKVKSLERGPLKRLARLTLEMIRLFIADPFIVPVQANNGIKPMLYNPKNYTADFEPKVRLMIDSQQRKRQEQQAAIQTFQLLIADPTNNLKEVKQIMLPKVTDLDKDEVTRIIETPQEMGMTDPGMGASMGAGPMGEPMGEPLPMEPPRGMSPEMAVM